MGLRELRHHTSEVIARVRRGETMKSPSTGTPVARLVPFHRPNAPRSLPGWRLQGDLHPAKNPGYLPQRLHPVNGADPSPLTRALLEERDSVR